jgi:hypothetical protein
MLRDAAARRLAREARHAGRHDALVTRLRRALAAVVRGQRSDTAAAATSRTPSSMSDVATAP